MAPIPTKIKEIHHPHLSFPGLVSFESCRDNYFSLNVMSKKWSLM